MNRTSQRVRVIARSASDCLEGARERPRPRRAAGADRRVGDLEIRVRAAARAPRRAPRRARSRARGRAVPAPSASALAMTSCQRRPVLPLQPLERRQAILDLLQPRRRGVDRRRVRPQEEREILELRFDARRARRGTARTAASSAASSPTRFQTVAERRQGGVVAVVERVVGLGAEPLEPVGVGEHLPRRRELLVLARLRLHADRSRRAGRRGTRARGRLLALASQRAARVRRAACCQRAKAAATACALGVSAGEFVEQVEVRRRDRAAPDARAGRADRRARRASSRSAALVASAPSMKARLRPWAEISRRTISSRARPASRRWLRWSRVSSPVRTRSAEARPPTSRPTAPTRMDLPAPVSPVRTFKPGSNSSSRRSMTARWRMREGSASMHGRKCQSYQMFDSDIGRVLRFARTCAVPAARLSCSEDCLHTLGSTPLRCRRRGAAGRWGRRADIRHRSSHRARQLARQSASCSSCCSSRPFPGASSSTSSGSSGAPSDRRPRSSGLPQEQQVLGGAGGLSVARRQPARRPLPIRLRRAERAAPRRRSRGRQASRGRRDVQP